MNVEKVQNGLLDQIRVFWKDLTFPFFIHSGFPIFLRVSKYIHVQRVRLSEDDVLWSAVSSSRVCCFPGEFRRHDARIKMKINSSLHETHLCSARAESNDGGSRRASRRPWQKSDFGLRFLSAGQLAIGRDADRSAERFELRSIWNLYWSSSAWNFRGTTNGGTAVAESPRSIPDSFPTQQSDYATIG